MFSVILIMLGLWTWSLVQFILVVAGTSKTKTKISEIYGSESGSPVFGSRTVSAPALGISVVAR